MGYSEAIAVAPPAGAWIETGETVIVFVAEQVAPPAGAWIETLGVPVALRDVEVAPPAGAWIETSTSCTNC